MTKEQSESLHKLALKVASALAALETELAAERLPMIHSENLVCAVGELDDAVLAIESEEMEEYIKKGQGNGKGLGHTNK